MPIRMTNREIITALEIGTSKVCSIVAEIKDHRPSIIGIGQSISQGVRKSNIVDKRIATLNVRHSLAEAEQMANVVIDEVVVAVAGSGISWKWGASFKEYSPKGKILSNEDYDDLSREALDQIRPIDHVELWKDWLGYDIDGKNLKEKVTGARAKRVSTKYVAITAPSAIIDEKKAIMDRLSLHVLGFIFSGVAAAAAVTSEIQRDLGVLVIDIGAGSTNFVLYHKKLLQAAGSIPVGGDHITLDIATYLGVSLEKAERIKIALSRNLNENSKVDNLDENEVWQIVTMNRISLEKVVALRLEEICEIVKNELKKAEIKHDIYTNIGVILTGGASQTVKFNDIAKIVFGVPVRRSKIISFPGLSDHLNCPEFATPIGLILEAYNLLQQGVLVKDSSFQRLWRELKDSLRPSSFLKRLT